MRIPRTARDMETTPNWSWNCLPAPFRGSHSTIFAAEISIRDGYNSPLYTCWIQKIQLHSHRSLSRTDTDKAKKQGRKVEHTAANTVSCREKTNPTRCLISTAWGVPWAALTRHDGEFTWRGPAVLVVLHIDGHWPDHKPCPESWFSWMVWSSRFMVSGFPTHKKR